MVEFMTWIFSLKSDAVVGPWIKDNLIVLGFIGSLPFFVYQLWWKNMQRIKALKDKSGSKQNEQAPLQVLNQINPSTLNQYLDSDEGKRVIWTIMNKHKNKLSEVKDEEDYSVTDDDPDDGLRDR